MSREEMGSVGADVIADSITDAVREEEQRTAAEKVSRARMTLTLGTEGTFTPEQRSLQRAFEAGPQSVSRSPVDHPAMGAATGGFSMRRDWGWHDEMPPVPVLYPQVPGPNAIDVPPQYVPLKFPPDLRPKSGEDQEGFEPPDEEDGED